MAILAYNKPVYQPARRIIASMASIKSNTYAGIYYPTTLIQLTLTSPTTAFNNDYLVGTIVRLVVPAGYGMQQANGQTATILFTSTNLQSLASDQIIIDLDTGSYDTFSVPQSYPSDYQYAQVIPIGEVSATLAAATQNVLPYPAN